MQKMLAEQGFGSFEATALNDAARVRGRSRCNYAENPMALAYLRIRWVTHGQIVYECMECFIEIHRMHQRPES